MALQVGELFAALTVDQSAFNEGLSSAQNNLKNVGDKMQEIGGTLTKTVTLPIVGIGAAAVLASANFEDSFNKVLTVADQTAVGIDDLKEGILEISNVTGESATTLNQAMYQMISATGDTASALGNVEVASKLAIAGFTDTESAVNGLTSVMNAFGLQGTDAMQNVADMMVVAQNTGKTTVAELAQSLFQVQGAAKAAGLGIDQMLAALAGMTSQGTPTSVATTQLRQLLVELTKAGSDARDTFEKLAGKSFNDFIAQGGTLSQALALMNDEATKTGVNFRDMFSSVEAANAAGMLIGTGADKFTASLDAMGQSAGAVDKAFDQMNQGSKDAMTDMMNSITNLGIAIGDILAPVVSDVANFISKIVIALSQMDPSLQKAIIAVAAVAAAIGPVILAIGFLLSSISSIITFLTPIIAAFTGGAEAAAGFGGAIALLSGPIGWIIAGVTALIGVFVALWTTNEGFRDKMVEIWNVIWENIQGILSQLVEIFQITFNTLLAFWNTWGADIIASCTVVFETLFGIFNGFVEFIRGFLEVIIGLMTGDFKRVWVGFGEMFKGILDAMIAMVKGFVNSVIGLFNGMISALNGLKFKVPDWVPGIGGNDFGLKIPKIPMLSTGGIVTKPTLSMIGEKGPEAIVPLSGNQLEKALSSIGYSGRDKQQPVQVVITGNSISSQLDIEMIGNQLVRKLKLAGIV